VVFVLLGPLGLHQLSYQSYDNKSDHFILDFMVDQNCLLVKTQTLPGPAVK
jgi:hypothetical protein